MNAETRTPKTEAEVAEQVTRITHRLAKRAAELKELSPTKRLDEEDESVHYHLNGRGTHFVELDKWVKKPNGYIDHQAQNIKMDVWPLSLFDNPGDGSASLSRINRETGDEVYVGVDSWPNRALSEVGGVAEISRHSRNLSLPESAHAAASILSEVRGKLSERADEAEKRHAKQKAELAKLEKHRHLVK